MDTFYRTHQYLLDHLGAPLRRVLLDEIDWSHRLIGIKGSRGVGKTTLLLQYAKEQCSDAARCLYVNLNNFYFSQHSLVEFAEEFYSQEGRVLLLDQIFKYENWSEELRICYDRFPELSIVFTGSTVMRLIEDNPHLQNIVASYNLRGFSFREYLNIVLAQDFPHYSMEDIINHHQEISKQICEKVRPLDYFQNYLHHGYYPFFLEKQNFSENLLKTMNMMIEVDILLIRKIELKYLSKIRKLLYILMQTSPAPLNVSRLSEEVEISRATVMNYIKYLKDARLLNLLYNQNDSYPKKPKKIFVHNTNLMHAVSPNKVDRLDERRTFLYNALHVRHEICLCRQDTEFLVDQRCQIKLRKKPRYAQSSKNILYAVDDIELGAANEIPLWLFGFLY